MQINVYSDIFWYGDMLLHVWAKKKKNIYIYIYIYTNCMEKRWGMTSSTHSFAYSYWLFKKCFVKNYETFVISYLPYFLTDFNQNFHCSVRFFKTLSIEFTWTWTGFNLSWKKKKHGNWSSKRNKTNIIKENVHKELSKNKHIPFIVNTTDVGGGGCRPLNKV